MTQAATVMVKSDPNVGMKLQVPTPEQIANLPDGDAAKLADASFRALHGAMTKAWWLIGEYMSAMHDRQLWLYLTKPDGSAYSGFKDWVETATERGRTTIYGDMALAKELQIPRDDLMKMRKDNAWRLLTIQRKAGLSKITPELIKAACEMDIRAFRSHTHNLLPGAAADEDYFNWRLPVSLSPQVQHVERILAALTGTNIREDWVDRLLTAFLQAPCDELAEQGIDVTNEEAYNLIMAGKVAL